MEVAARDGWQQMLPGRLYRTLRFRDPADGRPFAGVRELSEHEALVAMKARLDGVPTAEVVGIGEVDVGSHLIAYEEIDGTPLSECDDVDAAILPDVWQVVVRLRAARIAHRSLTPAAIVVRPDGSLAVTRFAVGDLTGEERVLAGDVAEVLAWASDRFGVDETVDAAIGALGPGVVVRALPRLQPLALTPATRSSIDHELLERVSSTIRDRTGAAAPSLAPVERVKPRSVFMAAMAVVAIYTLAPQLAGSRRCGVSWTEPTGVGSSWR
ncbi:MAG: hypothetical protein R2698_11400 [Microthrixaceae bacterium]